MKTELSSLPGYSVCEYLLILHPHQDLVEKIVKIKNEFYEKHKADNAKWGKPHITLVNFLQLKMMEERIINRLKMVAMATPEFKVELKDFGSFPSHTIYINVESQASIQKLVKSIKPAQPLLRLKDKKPHFIDNPDITVARKLQPWQFEQGWLEYSNKHFSGKFIAKSMTLLRKYEGMK